MVAEAMGRRFRPRRGTVRPNLPFGACGLSVGEEQPSFPRAGGCGPGPHSLVWGVRVGRPRLLGRTALGRALASGRQSGLPTIRLAKAGYYWFEPFRAARAWRRRGLGVSRHGLSLFRGAARYTREQSTRGGGLSRTIYVHIRALTLRPQRSTRRLRWPE